MKMKRFLFFLIFSAVSICFLFAQDIATLKNILLKNNPYLKQMELEYKALLKKAIYERKWPDPTFGYGHYIDSVETRVGSQKRKFFIAQKIPYRGKISLKYKMALIQADIQKQKYSSAVQEYLSKFLKLANEYYFLTRKLSIVQEIAEIYTYLENIIKTKYLTSQSPYNDLLRVKMELDKIEDDLKTIKEWKGNIARQIAYLLNMEVEKIDFSPLEKREFRQPDFKNIKETYLKRLKNNPMYQLAKLMVEYKKLDYKFSRKAKKPDFTVSLNYIKTSKRTDMLVDDNGKDPLILSFSFNMPFFHAREYQSLIKSKSILLDAANQKEKDTFLKLKNYYSIVFFRLEDTNRKKLLYQNSLLPKAKQSMEVATQAYRAGGVDINEMITTIKTYLNFKLNLEKLQIEENNNYIDLLACLGELK